MTYRDVDVLAACYWRQLLSFFVLKDESTLLSSREDNLSSPNATINSYSDEYCGVI